MNQLKFNVLGLMSGTSLDGLDLCFCSFEFDGNVWQFKILNSDTRPYSASLKATLSGAHLLNSKELALLDEQFGNFLGDCVNEFIATKTIENIDFIGSHGHTVLHQPEKKITLQIGNGPELYKKTGNSIICDFRLQDVLLGGQGAPLVPIGDELLFNQYAACLNLGGFANVSMQLQGSRNAFDICPLNIALNEVCKKLGHDFDDNGDFARSGKIIPELYRELNSLDFYRQSPPKSLGKEWVEAHIFPKLEAHSNHMNILHTLTEHAAFQIASILKPIKGDVLATGGGVFNSFLIGRINHHSGKKVVIPSAEIINFKEALIFAFLAVLRFNNLPNCLSSVTGAASNHSSGRIYN